MSAIKGLSGRAVGASDKSRRSLAGQLDDGGTIMVPKLAAGAARRGIVVLGVWVGAALPAGIQVHCAHQVVWVAACIKVQAAGVGVTILS